MLPSIHEYPISASEQITYLEISAKKSYHKCMDVIIGYESALQYWRTVGPRFLHGAKERRSATACARKAMRSQEKPRLSEGNRRPAGCTLPVNALVGTTSARVQTKSVLGHRWGSLPEQSVEAAGEGFFVRHPGILLSADGKQAEPCAAHPAGVRALRYVRSTGYRSGSSSRGRVDVG